MVGNILITAAWRASRGGRKPLRHNELKVNRKVSVFAVAKISLDAIIQVERG